MQIKNKEYSKFVQFCRDRLRQIDQDRITIDDVTHTQYDHASDRRGKHSNGHWLIASI